jgi:hypothetical protein
MAVLIPKGQFRAAEKRPNYSVQVGSINLGLCKFAQTEDFSLRNWKKIFYKIRAIKENWRGAHLPSGSR